MPPDQFSPKTINSRKTTMAIATEPAGKYNGCFSQSGKAAELRAFQFQPIIIQIRGSGR